MNNSNKGESKMQNDISKDFENLILKYGFIAVKNYLKSKDKEAPLVLDENTVIKGTLRVKPIDGSIIGVTNNVEPVINDRFIADTKVKAPVIKDLIKEEAQYKGLRIRLHNLYKEGRFEEETIHQFGKLIPVLTISIEISGLIKSNPKAKLSAKYTQDVTKYTVLGEFYNNAFEYAKSMIDELKAE